MEGHRKEEEEEERQREMGQRKCRGGERKQREIRGEAGKVKRR